MIRAIGGSALLGAVAMGASTPATADGGVSTDIESDDDWTTEALSPREEGQLRGGVLSSSAFKAVRNAARERDFKPQMGEATGIRVRNDESGVERLALKIPCEPDRGSNPATKQGAVIYGMEDDERIQARCISQVEGEPVIVDTAVTDASKKGSWKDVDVSTVNYLPMVGGE